MLTIARDRKGGNVMPARRPIIPQRRPYPDVNEDFGVEDFYLQEASVDAPWAQEPVDDYAVDEERPVPLYPQYRPNEPPPSVLEYPEP